MHQYAREVAATDEYCADVYYYVPDDDPESTLGKPAPLNSAYAFRCVATRAMLAKPSPEVVTSNTSLESARTHGGELGVNITPISAGVHPQIAANMAKNEIEANYSVLELTIAAASQDVRALQILAPSASGKSTTQILLAINQATKYRHNVPVEEFKTNLAAGFSVQGQTVFPLTLVLYPCRLQAIQNAATARLLTECTAVTVGVVYGGIPSNVLSSHLIGKGGDIIFASMGRLLYYLDQGTIDLSNLQMIIIDEADAMSDKFRDHLKEVLANPTLNEDYKVFAFSSTATLSSEQQLSELLPPGETDFEQYQAGTFTKQLVCQEERIYEVDDHRIDTLLEMLRSQDENRPLDISKPIIVFVKTKRQADSDSNKLDQLGEFGRVRSFHGDTPQQEREDTMRRMRSSDPAQQINITFATFGHAARGYNFTSVNQAVMLTIPDELQDFLQAGCRVGRNGERGVNVILCSNNNDNDKRMVDRYIKHVPLPAGCRVYKNSEQVEMMGSQGMFFDPLAKVEDDDDAEVEETQEGGTDDDGAQDEGTEEVAGEFVPAEHSAGGGTW
jgi:superfamily II DNA/RNA helicase